MAQYRLLHLSDFHFCIEPNRKNRIALWRDTKQGTLTIEGYENTKFRTVRFKSAKDAVLKALRTSAPLQRRETGHSSSGLISDFYFSSYRPLPAELVSRFAHHNRNQLDLIVVSGDLATTGTTEDLQAAKAYFREDPQWGKFLDTGKRTPILDLGLPVLLLPGNHDRYNDNIGTPGGREFDHQFNQDWPQPGRRWTRFSVVQHEDQEPLVVVAADFSLRSVADTSGNSWRQSLGQGKCHQDVLDELVEITVATRRALNNAAVVWAIHFPPADTIEDPSLHLVDGNKLVEAAANHSVSLILAGHIHEKTDQSLSRGTVLVSASACAVDFTKALGFHLLELSVSDGEVRAVTANDFRYDVALRGFLPDGQRVFKMNH